jgi:dienelactone hydrolase
MTSGHEPLSHLIRHAEVRILVDFRELQGTLSLPRGCQSVVIFAHGSGSGRFSPRNQFVASVLQASGIGTLLMDLLGEDEEQQRATVFDIELLAHRLEAAVGWLGSEPTVQGCRFGYFGASTGAAAALVAAARRLAEVYAIVSRGGRPDLAADELPHVQAPTLLIVGGSDDVVMALNEKAFSALRCPKRLVIVPGASHLFREPGTLEVVASLAAEWFTNPGSSSE